MSVHSWSSSARKEENMPQSHFFGLSFPQADDMKFVFFNHASVTGPAVDLAHVSQISAI